MMTVRKMAMAWDPKVLGVTEVVREDGHDRIVPGGLQGRL